MTDKDRPAAAELEPLVWGEYSAAEIMTAQLQTVPHDWTVEQLATFLIDHSISGAPVVDEGGLLAGVVSLTDIVRHSCEQSLDLGGRSESFYASVTDRVLAPEEARAFRESVDSQALVADIMTPVVFEVTPDTSLLQVAEAMVRGKIHRVLVTEDNKLLGIITALDLLRLQCLR